MNDRDQFIIDKLTSFGLADEFHDFLHRPDALGRLSTGVRGFQWETELASMAEARGMEVLNVSNKNKPYDIMINGLKVQAKASRDKDVIEIQPPRRRACAVERRYLVGEFDVMAMKLLQSGRMFIVPAKELEDAQLPGHVKACFRWRQLARYEDAWQVMCGAKVANPQRSLFSTECFAIAL